MTNVLIASLGESPIVITAMFDLLTKTKQIDEVIVLHPQGDMVDLAYGLIEEELQGKCVLRQEVLPFEDANKWGRCLVFLRTLYQILLDRQGKGDVVYLSLAGGRKSMSALMAWVVPFFSCIQALYHVLDKDESHFVSIEDLIGPSQVDRKSAMHPDLKSLNLVDIPFEKEQQISDKLHMRLLDTTEDELDEMPDDQANSISFVQTIASNDPILEVLVTKHAAQQYQEMCKNDVNHAKEFFKCFQQMHSPVDLRKKSHDIFAPKGKTDKKYAHIPPGLVFHFFKRRRTTERPVFHTTPKDIKNCSDNEVEQVIVSQLEIKVNGEYPSLKDILANSNFSLYPTMPIETLPAVGSDNTDTSVLIIPLGRFPMVATQLYTLLRRTGQKIREVILLYPQHAIEIHAGALLVKKALREEGSIPCTLVPIQGLKDVASRDDCIKYQKALEERIDKLREKDSKCHIELALSGGRKGMAALTIFAAQKKKIRYVYHTLITNTELNKEVDKLDEKALRELDPKERNDKLFLREFERDGLDTKFVLFQVPVFSSIDE